MARYYTLDEAAKLLPLKQGLECSITNVLEYALRGNFRLCTRFEGFAEISAFGSDEKLNPFMYMRLFAGYIQIPQKDISLKKDVFQFQFTAILEITCRLYQPKDQSTLNQIDNDSVYPAEWKERLKFPGWVIQQVSAFAEETMKAEYMLFEINSCDALIPEKDLLNFLKEQKNEDTDQGIKTWKENARQIGLEIAKKAPKYSIEIIAEKTREEMMLRHKRGNSGMTGRGGKFPNAETIKRHALTGIKS